MELGLKNKTVIVTGSGSNIGRGIALAFAKEGSNLVIAEIDEAQGEKVKKDFEEYEKKEKTNALLRKLSRSFATDNHPNSSYSVRKCRTASSIDKKY